MTLLRQLLADVTNTNAVTNTNNKYQGEFTKKGAVPPEECPSSCCHDNNS